VDPINSHIYFTQQPGGGDKVRRCDYVGANLVDLVIDIPAGKVQNINIDLAGEKIYYFRSDDYIYSAPIDGGTSTLLYDSSSTLLVGFELDTTNGKIYVVEASPSAIKKMNLTDGSDIETLYTGATQPVGIAVFDIASSILSIDISGNLLSKGHRHIATMWHSDNWRYRP
jgi:hypothetical protein